MVVGTDRHADMLVLLTGVHKNTHSTDLTHDTISTEKKTIVVYCTTIIQLAN